MIVIVISRNLTIFTVFNSFKGLLELILFLYNINTINRFDEKTQKVNPVSVNISIIIKDILQIKEIDHTYTLKVHFYFNLKI